MVDEGEAEQRRERGREGGGDGFVLARGENKRCRKRHNFEPKYLQLHFLFVNTAVLQSHK